jgi:lipocalin
MKASAFASLVVTLLLIACADEENTLNVPPDLRLEDVLGCWYRVGKYECLTLECPPPDGDHDQVGWSHGR